MGAISKRTRFEVLRRDDFTCRYCGRSAPEVKLHVDHLVPKSWGGCDEKWNLAAACEDCNLAKSDTPAPDRIITAVRQDEAANLNGQVAACSWCHRPFLVVEGYVEDADMCDPCTTLSYGEWSRGFDWGLKKAGAQGVLSQ